MEVGDLVEIKKPSNISYYTRKDVGKIGIIVEKYYSIYFGHILFVKTEDGIWRMSPNELRLINDGSR